MNHTIADNLEKIRAAINVASADSLLSKQRVALIAVSKVQPDEKIDAALKAGQRVFGENRVQEAYTHWETRRANYPDVELHLIGPLQTNKAKEAIGLFDVIQTLDREKLANRLAVLYGESTRKPALYVQMNVGQEPQKAGIAPAEAAEFVRWAREDKQLPVTGLMCIPPADADPAPHFAWLAQQQQRLGLAHLSMGMSADYEVAICFGATHVRVGTAVFGGRGL